MLCLQREIHLHSQDFINLIKDINFFKSKKINAVMESQSWSIMQQDLAGTTEHSFSLPQETEFETTAENTIEIFNSSLFNEIEGKAYCKTANGKRFILINTKYFQIISSFNGFCSDTKRLSSSVGRDRVGRTAPKFE